MKKNLLIISSFVLTLPLFSQYQGFENWTSTSILTLDNYQSGAEENTGALVTTYSSTDSYIGSKSIKLETLLTPSNDTAFGYFYTGNPDGNNPKPGQAVSLADVDSLIGYYKSNLLPNDSAIVFCSIFKSGVQTANSTSFFKGIQTTWKRFAFSINAATADSMLLAIAGGNPFIGFKGIPGSWLMLDNIQLKASSGTTAPILNHSFENWTPQSIDQPSGWQTPNPYTIGEPVMPVVKSTDTYSGTFALELNTIQSQYGDTISGMTTNGNFGPGNGGGHPYTNTPLSVELYYKYAPANGDFSSINFQFRKNGAILNNYGTSLIAASNYTQWTTSISLLTMPDTLLISAFSGQNPGSKLKIDAIDFLLPVGETEYINVEKIVSYPNPVIDKLSIRFNLKKENDVTVRLIDITGKELMKRSLGNLSSGSYNESFAISEFSSGVYFIEFTLGSEKTVNKFMIK